MVSLLHSDTNINAIMALVKAFGEDILLPVRAVYSTNVAVSLFCEIAICIAIQNFRRFTRRKTYLPNDGMALNTCKNSQNPLDSGCFVFKTVQYLYQSRMLCCIND